MRSSGVTSMALASRIVALAIAGVVAVRNQSAVWRPSSGSGQPSQACAADSTNVSQSRSMRLEQRLRPRLAHRPPAARGAAEQHEPAARAGCRAAHARASITEW